MYNCICACAVSDMLHVKRLIYMYMYMYLLHMKVRKNIHGHVQV